jgi:hypothetical protein
MNGEAPPGFLCKEEHWMQLIKMGETCRVGIGQALYLTTKCISCMILLIYMTSFHRRCWCDDDDDGMGSSTKLTNLRTTCLQQLINWQTGHTASTKWDPDSDPALSLSLSTWLAYFWVSWATVCKLVIPTSCCCCPASELCTSYHGICKSKHCCCMSVSTQWVI